MALGFVSVIQSFGSKGTADIYNGFDTPAARKTLPKDLWQDASERMDQINSAARLKDLLLPPSNRLHALKGDLKGFHSISINMKYRIIFRFDGGHAYDVEITNHYD